MHILDVIGSVPRSSKCNKIAGGWSVAPDSTEGANIAPPDLLAEFKGPTLRPLLLNGREGRGAKMIHTSGHQKLSRRHCLSEVV